MIMEYSYETLKDLKRLQFAFTFINAAVTVATASHTYVYLYAAVEHSLLVDSVSATNSSTKLRLCRSLQ